MGKRRVSPAPKPRYHYFYGSTADAASSTSVTSSVASMADPGSPATIHSETEVLIGESLVPTDGEEETPTNSVQDLTQIVVTNGIRHHHQHQHQGTYLLDPNVGASTVLAKEKEPPPPIWTLCLNNPWCSLGGTSRIGHITRVLVLTSLAICMFVLINVLSPNNSAAAGGLSPGGGGRQQGISIPFPVVDRANYGDAASMIINTQLFDDHIVYRAGGTGGGWKGLADIASENESPNAAIDPVLNVPFPTGAFWTNLVVDTTSDGLSYPIVSYPYAFKWSASLLQASYPAARRKVDATSVSDVFQPDVTFSTLESVQRRVISRFDSLSVTLRFETAGGSWETYIVQGTPYITIKYQDSTPVLRALSTFLNVMCPFDEDGNYIDGNTLSADDLLRRRRRRGLRTWGVCTPSQDSSKQSRSTTLYGVQFLLQTEEKLTWILFASEPISLTFDSVRRTRVTGSKKFSGVLRLALIAPTPERGGTGSNSSSLVPLSESSGLRRLVYHSGTYPVGGVVSWDFRSPSPTTPIAAALDSIKPAAATLLGATKLKSSLQGSSAVRTATVQFAYQTRQMNEKTARLNSAKSPLLMLGLPHHKHVLRDSMILSRTQFDLRYRSIKGSMIPVVGSTWSYEETLPQLGFEFNVFDTTDGGVDMDDEVVSLIMRNVKADLDLVRPASTENLYGLGKQIARIAQLAHIADVLTSSILRKQRQQQHLLHNENVTSNQTLSSPTLSSTKQTGSSDEYLATLQKATDLLGSWLATVFENQIDDQLLYDAKFGGLVSKNGLGNPQDDFGNGRYNDHHFHYGYLLYASAVMGSLNSTFVQMYGSHVDNILYDIAYTKNKDSTGSASDGAFFPLSRHKSWFDGHSFATGLFPFANGKSQESTSEAVNGYYGAHLWSMVRHNTGNNNFASSPSEIADFSKLLMMMEIRGAKTYWHMYPPPEIKSPDGNRTESESITLSLSSDPIYDATFASNYMVGNLGMLDAVASTWFGKEKLYVHMINFMPVTAVTELLFPKKYVKMEYPKVIETLNGSIPMAWKGYTVCDQAIINPSEAWEAALSLRSAELDSALSKSQVLYWIATQRNFTYMPSGSEDGNGDTYGGNDGGDSSPRGNAGDLASCESHSMCTALGLTGECCPTSTGIKLECCN